MNTIQAFDTKETVYSVLHLNAGIRGGVTLVVELNPLLDSIKISGVEWDRPVKSSELSQFTQKCLDTFNEFNDTISLGENDVMIDFITNKKDPFAFCLENRGIDPERYFEIIAYLRTFI